MISRKWRVLVQLALRIGEGFYSRVGELRQERGTRDARQARGFPRSRPVGTSVSTSQNARSTDTPSAES